MRPLTSMRTRHRRARLLTLGVISIAVLVLDLVTKRWAAATVADAPDTVIDPWLTFTFRENAGSAFNLVPGGPILGIAAIVAVLIVVGSVWHPRPSSEVIGFALVGGGALGNLADRVFRGDGWLDGRVIDWIQFPNFPVFNVADSAITIGVATLLIGSFRQGDGGDDGR